MAEFEVRKTTGAKWYWIFQANNNKTIARSSEDYENRSDCLHSIRIVKEQSPAAKVTDMTTNPPTNVSTLP